MGFRVRKGEFLVILLIIISIYPAYNHVAGHMTSSMVLVPGLFLLCCLFQHKLSVVKVRELTFFFLWCTIRTFIYCYHGDWFNAISFDILILSIAFVVFNYVTSVDRFVNFIDYLIYVSLFLCLLGIVEGLTGFNPFLYLDDAGTVTKNLARLGIIRIMGFTAQTTHYALYVSMVAFLTIYRISIEKDKWKQKKFKYILMLQIINILFTLTRSTILCFIACILLLLLKQGLSKFFKIVIPVVIVGIVLALFFETSFLGQFIYMMLALVNSSHADKLAAGALSEYTNGVADRFNLYAWVYESVKNNLLFGMGEKTQFAYTHRVDMLMFSYYETKKSIEVYPLYLLFHFGLIGMVHEMLMYVHYTLKSLKDGLKKRMYFESKLNFNYIVFVVFIMNIVNWFAVAQGEEATTLYIIMALCACYRSLALKNFLGR